MNKHIEYEAEQKNISILIVDDEVSNRVLLEAIFQSIGWKTLIAEDGLQAVEIVNQTIPSLILMDINMPNLNGIAATKIIHQKFKTIPIIILSANSNKDIIEECYKVGACGYLIKPFKANLLLSYIQNYLN